MKITVNEVGSKNAISHELNCFAGKPGSGLGKWEVIFHSADGTVQKFDGKNWTETKPAAEFNCFTNPRT